MVTHTVFLCMAVKSPGCLQFSTVNLPAVKGVVEIDCGERDVLRMSQLRAGQLSVSSQPDGQSSESR